VTYLIGILGLGFLVFIHELGHFLTSLALRMRPRRFYIGFPPAVWKTERGGIEYGIGAIPLGGMVKIPGMHRPAPADVDHAFARALEEAPALAAPLRRLRNAIDAGDHEAALDAVALLPTTLESHTLSPAAAKAADRGAQDIGDALGPDAYWRAPTWKRVLVIAAGPLANIVLAVALFTGLYLSSGGAVTATIDRVLADRPAATMGLRTGDTIVAIAGKPVSASEIPAAIAASKGDAITVVVSRNGETVTLGPARALRDTDGVHRLGLALAGEPLGISRSVGEAFRTTGLVTKDIVKSLGQLVVGKGRENISSPVGIVEGSSNAAKQGTETYLWVLGLISLSIALLNLLPLLPLDGGHILFSLIEGARGRGVRREIYERVSFVGIGLVLLLFFVGLTNDIGRHS
jgi:regulator of sigma E protease